MISTVAFAGGSAGKESACSAGDLCREDPLEKDPLQYSGLENSMDCIVHGVASSWTRLSDFHFHFLHTRHLQLFPVLVGPHVKV